MDFGFSRDPDTILKVAIDKKRMVLYCKEYLYSNGHSTNELIEILERTIDRKDMKTATVAISNVGFDRIFSIIFCLF